MMVNMEYNIKANVWAVVVAQLVERSLPIPEVCSSNSVIGKNLFTLNICLLSTVYWKDENKEKEAGNGPLKKNIKANETLVNLAVKINLIWKLVQTEV